MTDAGRIGWRKICKKLISFEVLLNEILSFVVSIVVPSKRDAIIGFTFV
jgi:hypothetical protein